jgi:hypothetical protein
MKAGTAQATIIPHGRFSRLEGRPVSVSQDLQKTQGATRPGWHGAEASAVAQELGVEPERGLSVEEARRRLQSHGPNRLAGAKKESGFQAFLRQYRDFMQIILLAAAAISLGDGQASDRPVQLLLHEDQVEDADDAAIDQVDQQWESSGRPSPVMRLPGNSTTR